MSLEHGAEEPRNGAQAGGKARARQRRGRWTTPLEEAGGWEEVGKELGEAGGGLGASSELRIGSLGAQLVPRVQTWLQEGKAGGRGELEVKLEGGVIGSKR